MRRVVAVEAHLLQLRMRLEAPLQVQLGGRLRVGQLEDRLEGRLWDRSPVPLEEDLCDE